MCFSFYTTINASMFSAATITAAPKIKRIAYSCLVIFLPFHFYGAIKMNARNQKRKQKIYIIMGKLRFGILPAASRAAINQFHAAIKMQS